MAQSQGLLGLELARFDRSPRRNATSGVGDEADMARTLRKGRD